MGEPDAELSNFLSQTAEEFQRRDAIAATAERYELFLIGEGEMLGLNDETVSPWYEDDALRGRALDNAIRTKETILGRPINVFEMDDLVKDFALAVKEHKVEVQQLALALEEKRRVIATLAAQKIAFDEMWLTTGELPPPDIKKRLQAHLLLGSYSDAWLELINEEYDGEQLREIDEPIVREVAPFVYEAAEDIERRVEQKTEQFTGFLADRGKVALSARETVALTRLVADAIFLSPAELIQQLEDAVLSLSYEGILDKAWSELVQCVYAQEDISEG